MNNLSVQFQISAGQLAKPSIMDLVGNTPLIPLTRLSSSLPPQVRLYGKAEWFNPGGSIKDRPASNIIRDALERGLLQGKVLLDSSSGNMGIAYATYATSLGIPVHLILPGNASPARIAILRAHGVELTLSDPLEGSDGAQRMAEELAAAQPERYYYANQYSNPSNWRAHYLTTGPELVSQTEGRITHFVAGMGTTGTMTGTGRYLKAYNPDIKLVGVQPAAPMNGIEGVKHLSSSRVPAIYDASLVDELAYVETEEAHSMARRLAREEGLLVGVSAAAATHAAVQVAETLVEGDVVMIFPDSGVKYLDQPFWNEA